MNLTRPPLESLACVNPDCTLYAESGKENLVIRKIYGVDQIRYLRCRSCGQEFSERKHSAWWNVKIPQARAVAIAEQLAEGTSIKGTARLTRSHPDTVRRLALRRGRQAQAFHDAHAQGLESRTLEMDERDGYIESKMHQLWDAVTIDAKSKFIVHLEVAERNESLFESLMRHSAERLVNPQDLLLMTDGAISYSSLFAEIFGIAYFPPAKERPGAFPTRVTAFLAPSLMLGLSSVTPPNAWWQWKLSRLMAAGSALSKA